LISKEIRIIFFIINIISNFSTNKVYRVEKIFIIQNYLNLKIFNSQLKILNNLHKNFFISKSFVCIVV